MDPLTTRARSWLFVPANRQDRFAKAAASGADRVIIDLEDAVGPADKIQARDRLIGASIPSDVPVYLRVNSVTTPWFDDDVAVAARLAITGVLLPKADTAQDVERVADRIPTAQRIIPIIETALGSWNVLEVARASRVERLVFGALDFQLDTGMHDDGDTFSSTRSRITIASKIAGIGAPIDAVTLAIDDEDMLTRDAARSRRFGFDGKLCIHPKQLAATNAAFRPTADDVDWARGLLAERAARPGDAVFSYRGTMVDRPVIERATRILAASQSIT
jgi:citrate lyase subunit beta / citryl-CoA lyase